MSKIIEIPGGTAELREPSELRVRDRRLIETAALAAASVIAKLPDSSDAEALAKTKLSDLNLDRHEANALMELQDATIVAFVVEPKLTMDTIGDLTPEVYDALTQATRSLGADVARGVDFSPNPDKSTPTGPSSDSDGSLRDEATLTLIVPPRPSGESTSTESSTQD